MNQQIIMKRAALMVLALVIFFACVATAFGAAKINTCSLITKPEIEAAVGQNITDSKLDIKESRLSADKQVFESCQYFFGPSRVLLITVNPISDPASKVKKRQKGMTVSDVQGIGDQSFFIAGHGLLQLNTYKDNSNLLITTTVPDMTEEASLKTALKLLMIKALTRL